MKRRYAFLLAAMLLAAPLSWAQQRATPVDGDTRLVTFDYDENQTYLVLTRPRDMTQIQLRPGEMVSTLAAGDPVNFTMAVTKDRNSVLIRPKYPDKTTSVTLITNQRTYPIVLRSTAEGGKWYQRVTWNFPQLIVDEIAAAAGPAQAASGSGAKAPANHEPVTVGEGDESKGGLAVDSLNFAYQVDGEAEFKPLQVFDDGVRTYLRLPDRLEVLPAVFAIRDGDAQLVNCTFDEHKKYLIVQGTSQDLLLKLGKAEVKVTRGGKKGLFNWGGNG